MSGQSDDAGLTLVELLVAMVISGLFMGLLAVLFANGVQAQAQATERDLATGRAGVISNSILTSVRAASGMVIVADNRALIAKVIAADGSESCRAWLVIADGDGEFRRTAGDTAFVEGDIIYKESASTISLTDRVGWSPLVERGDAVSDGVRGALGVQSGTNADGSARFVPVDADGDGLADAFGPPGSTLSIGLEVTLGDATVSVTNGVTMQAQSAGTGTTSCW